MSLFKQLANLICNPKDLPLKVLQRFPPGFLWARYYKLCQNAGIKTPLLILSFDCDTDQDIKVAWDVHSRLMDMGILPVYAVPGELLKRGEKVYQKIFDTGAEFINHGGREHTYFDNAKRRHVSSFFYDQQSLELLKEDIILGHDTLQDVLGISPKGFRTPHFGTFQRKKHLAFLYSTLKDLGYLFSSSTVPLKSYTKGPIYQDSGIFEIPVTGVFSEPMNILDTWAFFGAPDRQKYASNYRQECDRLEKSASANPLLINIYGDPGHIHNEPLFFESMKKFAQSMQNCNFSQVIEAYR